MKVLIIDDEPLVRLTLERVARSRGHTVSLAEEGLSGLEKWINESPDLVFLDVLMPWLNGPQVLKELGDKKTGKVVLISAYTGKYDVEKARSIGADLFISKPFDDIFQVMDRAEELVNDLGQEKEI